MDSTPETWNRLKALFRRALDLDEDERESFLAKECRGDPDLRAQLEQLLNATEKADEVLGSGAASEKTLLENLRSAFEEGRLSLGRRC